MKNSRGNSPFFSGIRPLSCPSLSFSVPPPLLSRERTSPGALFVSSPYNICLSSCSLAKVSCFLPAVCSVTLTFSSAGQPSHRPRPFSSSRPAERCAPQSLRCGRDRERFPQTQSASGKTSQILGKRRRLQCSAVGVVPAGPACICTGGPGNTCQ